MRYFAILKDSFREAVDSKVLYVLLAVTTLVILLVATLSFKPLSAQQTMEQFFPSAKIQGISLMFVALNDHELRKMHNDGKPNLQERDPKEVDELLQRMMLLSDYTLEKVDLLHGEPDSPHSDYLLTISHRNWRNDKEDEQTRQKKSLENVRSIFQKAEDLNFLRIGEIETLPREKKGAGTTKYRVPIEATPRTFRIWAHEPSLLFGAFPMEVLSAPLGYQLYIMSGAVLSLGAWVAVLVGVVITSFFIPNMLQKGTIDMLLVKPIHRWGLLLYKYIGGLSFIFLCTTYAIGGLWLVVGLRTGVWANGSLLLILTITFFFAILYAISVFVGVLTRSTISSIMLTIGMWFVFFLIGTAYQRFNDLQEADRAQEKRGKVIPPEQRWSDSKIAQAARIAHTITPRTSDLKDLNDLIIYADFMTSNVADMAKFDTSQRNWWESLLVSSAWIGLFLTLSCVWFSFKDY